MMNHDGGWMHGLMGGGMWFWGLFGIAVIVLPAVIIVRMSRK